MAIDRRALIIGNAVLFSALGCEVGGEDPTPDSEPPVRDGRVDPDVEPGDMQPEGDMAWQPDMAPGEDMSLEPDAGPDMGWQPDMAWQPDMGPVADMSLEPDMAPDMQWLPDMEPPDPDMALVPDMAPPEPDMAPPVGCGDLIGDMCQVADQGCCPDGMNPQAVCWGDGNGRLTWQAIPADFFCNCFQGPDQTDYTVACAVPGFVGIERAGRVLRGPRLRDLVAA